MHKNITFSAICLQPCKALQGSPSPPLQHPFGDSRGDFFLLFCKLFFEKNPHICAFFAFIASFILKMFKSCLAILLSWCYNTITEVYITHCRGDCAWSTRHRLHDISGRADPIQARKGSGRNEKPLKGYATRRWPPGLAHSQIWGPIS